MPLRILTLDQATTSGWCSNTERVKTGKVDCRYELGHFKLPKRDEVGERLVYMRKGVIDLIERFDPELVAHETPHFPFHDGGPMTLAETYKAKTPSFLPAGSAAEPRKGRFNVETVKFLQMVKGVLVEACAAKGVAIEDYPPASWRKTALGYGRAPPGSADDHMKAAMRRRAQMLGYPGLTEDEAEALGIMLHAEHGKPAAERAQGSLMLMAKGKL